MKRTVLVGVVLASAVLLARPAEAAPGGGRVAVLGPDRSALVPRLQRNFADTPSLLVSATVTTCSRDVVTRLVYELDADSAICTDGDTVTVWHTDGEMLSLVDAIPMLGGDDRSIELIAARATAAARTGRAAANPTSFTISNDGSIGPSSPPPA
ncbi:MAG: hypothetical protein KF837_44525, partial [Labilithrix sp.]|nr:hypothetical protein [Labilithrix sp.]